MIAPRGAEQQPDPTGALRYARAASITDAHPEICMAADFETFAREVLAYRGRRKGERYICSDAPER